MPAQLHTRLTLKHIIIVPPPLKPKILYRSLFVLEVITNCVDCLEFIALNTIKNTKLHSRIIINQYHLIMTGHRLPMDDIRKVWLSD